MMADCENNNPSLCPVRYALDIIGGKWKLPIMCLLLNHPSLRYNTIKRKIDGITNMMLTKSLKELEAAGIVHREQYNEIPPRVEYTLTKNGQDLLPARELLSKWGISQMNQKGAGQAGCEKCKSDSTKQRDYTAKHEKLLVGVTPDEVMEKEL